MLDRAGQAGALLLIGPAEGGPAGFPAAELEHYSGRRDLSGPKDDVRPLLRDCHVYVLPSYGEGMPRTVLEALAIGRPVVTTDANGCRDTVDDGVNGFMVPVGDAGGAGCRHGVVHRAIRPSSRPMAEASRLKGERRFDVRVVNRGDAAVLGLG